MQEGVGDCEYEESVVGRVFGDVRARVFRNGGRDRERGDARDIVAFGSDDDVRRHGDGAHLYLR